MEFITVSCPGKRDKGEVFIDASSQGESKTDDELNVFQCNPGHHYISMRCLVGKECRESTQLVGIVGTNPIQPMEVPFQCAT